MKPGSTRLPRIRMVTGMALMCATALAVSGCKNSNQLFQDNNDGGWFSQPVEMFKTPDWARHSAPTAALGPSGPVERSKTPAWARTSAPTAELGPSGPVGPEELVNADGSCAMSAAAAPPP